MIWILLLTALVADVSSEEYRGKILLTQKDYCERNRIMPRKCDNLFNKYLDRNPNLKLCRSDCSVYSNQCDSLPSNMMECSTRLDTNPTRYNIQDLWERELLEIPIPSEPLHSKVTNFTIELFKKAVPEGNGQNYVLSPLLVQSLLSYLTDGASNETAEAMKSVLKLTDGDLNTLKQTLEPSAERFTPTKNKLDFASRIFRSSRVELLESFQQTLNKKQVKVEEKDFSNQELAAKGINDWVSQQTRGKIQEIVDANSLNPDTQLMLVNALYFNGTWMYKFNKTIQDVFYLNENDRSPINMMYLTRDLRSGLTKVGNNTNGFRWVELPYDGDTLSMILLLPKERFQLDRELGKFNVNDFSYILSEIEHNEQDEVKLRVPTFKAESMVSLVDPLRQMGLGSIFDGEKPFDRVSKDPVKVSEVKQKSFLAVNERGTVATSITYATIIALSLPRITEFYVDQPFAAIIVDKENRLPLFMAKITKPDKFTEKNKNRG